MDTLLAERQKAFLALFKKNSYVSTFSVIALVSLVFAFLSMTSVFPTAPGIVWIVLGVSAGVGAALAYSGKTKLAFYPLVAWVAWVGFFIRTRNLTGLRDVTTGGWTLGPDLDPFLFLRWAKYIIAHGSLMANDTFRYVPIGFDTRGELILLPYLIAWFHNVASYFGSTSVEHSAVLFPVFMFVITVVAFYLFVYRVFKDSVGVTRAQTIAVISSIFLAILPPLLPRTIAGIPEKESAAFFFLFLGFYFFISSWKAKNLKWTLIHAGLAGIITAMMALVWGGYVYLFILIALGTLAAFLLGQVNRAKIYGYILWLLTAVVIMDQFSTRYNLETILTSTNTAIAFLVLGVMIVHEIISQPKIRSYATRGRLAQVPLPITSFVTTIILGVVGISLLLGPSFLLAKINGVINQLVVPTVDRIGVTVAENRQPYFGEWSSSFGPVIQGIPIFFWLFMIGSIVLFYNLIHMLAKNVRLILSAAYTVFLIAIVFSRYSSSSTFNGESPASLLFYFAGVLLFFGTALYYYYQSYKKGEQDQWKSIDFGLLLLFVFFIVSVLSARGAVRLIMVLVPPAAILGSYLVVNTISYYMRTPKENGMKTIAGVLAIGVVFATLFSVYYFYNVSQSTAQQYIPSSYTQQWQKAMQWVRESTPSEAVFGHWWDYGYWVQSIGERATILDGGNAVGYWNHLIGRYVLTGSDETRALEFLKAHKATHFLIDSSDIGKYTAFASIGSDVSYDRRSWFSTFIIDPSQVVESKNKTSYLYTGSGFTLDEDVFYTNNKTMLQLPGVGSMDTDKIRNVAGVGGIRLDLDKSGRLLQPTAIFVYNGVQHSIPIRYVYSEGQKLDFGTGLDAGIFLMPQIVQDSQGRIQVQENGAMLYLSNRTVNNLFTRLYLQGDETTAFKIAHIEDDPIVASLKSQGVNVKSFVYFQGVRGPIKIWNVTYPSGLTIHQEDLLTDFPDDLLLK